MCFPSVLNTLVTAVPIHNQLMRQQESMPCAQRGYSSCGPDSVLRLQVVNHAVDIWAVRHLRAQDEDSRSFDGQTIWIQ
jgi:hypothetical protein